MEEFELAWKKLVESGALNYVSPKEIASMFWRTALNWSKAMHDTSNEEIFSTNIKNELERN